MSSQKIILNEVTIGPRQEAVALKQQVTDFVNEGAETVLLDFSKVLFISGGFADELYNLKREFGNNVKILLKGSPRKMYSVICKRRAMIQKELSQYPNVRRSDNL